MSEQNLTPIENKSTPKKGDLAGGLILITIGLGLFVSQVTDLGWFFPLGLGLIFLIAGTVTRKAGLIIPGGIISGVGMGIVAIDNQWFAPQNSQASGGVFLLFFALGWLLITVLSKLFTDDTQIWPLIPGGIMVLIGGLVLMGETGLQILEQLSLYWPLILVAIGLSTLYQWYRNRA